MTSWRAFFLYEGPYVDDPAVSVVRDDEAQERILVADIPIDRDADVVLGDHGWRRTGDWEPGVDGAHAPVTRAGRGRIPRGVRAETKLATDVLAEVNALIGTPLGNDRSEVIASLVRRGLDSSAPMPRNFRAERLARLAAMTADPAHRSHGTNGGYVTGCRCDRCKSANVDYRSRAEDVIRQHRDRYLAELLADESDPRHGTTTAYNYGCYCPRCSLAQADYDHNRPDRNIDRIP